MVDLTKMLEFRLRMFNNSKEELSMKKVLSLSPRANVEADVFFVTSKGVYTHVYEYTACRGYLHDALRKRSRKSGMKAPVGFDGQSSMYICGTNRNKLNDSTFKLIEDFCAVCGYRKPKMCKVEKGQRILFKLDMQIFKNLYAVSFMFLVLKHPPKANVSKTFAEFIENHWTTKGAQDRAKLSLKEWSRIFPKGSLAWGDVYGIDPEGINHSSHHGEGVTELLQGRSMFPKIRGKINEILGGVDSYKETQGKYTGSVTREVKGSVSKIMFTIKYL